MYMTWIELHAKLAEVILSAFRDIPEQLIPLIARNIALMEQSEDKGPAKKAAVIAAVVSQSNQKINEDVLAHAIDASVAACNAAYDILEECCKVDGPSLMGPAPIVKTGGALATQFAKDNKGLQVDNRIDLYKPRPFAQPKAQPDNRVDHYVKKTPPVDPPAKPENRADLYKVNERHPNHIAGPNDVSGYGPADRAAVREDLPPCKDEDE